MIINIIAWILVGALAGWIAGKIMKTAKNSFWRNVVLGIAGSLVGGFLASLLGISAKAFSIGGLAVAVAGACLCIFLARKFAK